MVTAVMLASCGKPGAELAPDRPREIITAEEIESVNARDAFDVIKKLRANFLSYRGKTSLMNTSSPEPIVFVDDQAYGPISSLRTIPASQIFSIRLYRSWEATQKYGTGLMGGVIAIDTKQ